MEIATLPGFVLFESSCQSGPGNSLQNFRTGGKVQFQNSIEKSMRIDKATLYLCYTQRNLVTCSNQANNMHSTSNDCKQKAIICLVTLFLAFYLTFWYVIGSRLCCYSRLLSKSKLQCELSL